MPSFKFLMFLSSLLVISLLSLSSGNEAAPFYNTHVCSGTDFTANSTYQSNLDLVLSSLSTNATLVTGFSNASAGVVSGIFLCRGDVNATVCQDCVASGAKEILQRCILQIGAIIWYEECMVRYSNESIFATLNEWPGIYQGGSLTMPEAERVRFNELLGRTMDSLATLASNSSTGKKFATEEEEFNSSLLRSLTLYSLVQCTPDLTVSDCNKCLRGAIMQLPACCDGKQGGWILQPSCILRYGLNKFYNPKAASEPAFPPLVPGGVVVGGSKTSLLKIVAIVIPIAFSVVLFFIAYCFLRRRARKKCNTLSEENAGVEITTIESLQFDLDTIDAATDKFSDDNKIGEGGFGMVYKGTFSDGQQIAVKRLSKKYGQGAVEFKNEVVLIAKLNHRNLVRLLGFCEEGDEKLLIYEYVPNKSLDYFLFDPANQRQLDWSGRYKIIGGIAQGILYLHEDSRIRIIHRDLKVSNILLDDNMNAKISDFGLARIFVVDQTQGNTSQIVGTFGYMPPEYVIHGRYSVKSDVFSFGVLLLEIISGKKNSCFYKSELDEDLLSYAWKQWRSGTPMELLDPTVRHSCSRNEVTRCIQMGLLCVQEDPANRPTMASIVLMLNSYSVTLPSPMQPPFLDRSREKLNKAVELESFYEASVTEVDPR
ncbi:cysteine-rich receptor-like protein kinase 10 [Corylus avellana]|uniref:cysteine-rich receptor-like protein kinase 10 n=1 Tax=Corylus avellana TaxID=13451 RepID=UPI00286CC296|nr:cysteine-rich receptor-like protein kinase 10 [Corylus avellana]